MADFFRDKKILITGASSGIGREMAIQMVGRGAFVLLAARRTEKLEEVQALCGESHCSVHYLDLENRESIDRFVAELKEKQVTLDIVVHNAGVSQRSKAFETTMAVDRKIMEINFFGPVHLTRSLLPLLSSTANIVVISSIVGLMGFPLRSAYAASKHALHGYFESLQLENPQLKVSIICPGRIRTEISKNALTSSGSAHEQMDKGQNTGMPTDRCVRKILPAIEQGKKLTLVGGKELLMVYLRKYVSPLFYKIAKNIDPT